jgi:drug/metabolite transporter (DMT)-like permease
MSKTFISVLAGLGGMLGWGTSDFFASQSSGKIGNIRTFFWSQIAGLICILLFGIFFGLSFSVAPIILLYIIICGIADGLGYLMFYKAFEVGNVSVVSTTINLATVIAMVCAYIFLGQRITPLQFGAIILIIIGVIIVGLRIEDIKDRTFTFAVGVKEAIISSIIFGAFYWPINDYVLERAHWVTASLLIKFIAIVTVLFVVIIIRKNISIRKEKRNTKLLLVGIGILEAAAVLATNVGMMVGDSILIVPISSALTIVTIALAVIFLKEKVTKLQIVGILLTLVGIVMTAI